MFKETRGRRRRKEGMEKGGEERECMAAAGHVQE